MTSTCSTGDAAGSARRAALRDQRDQRAVGRALALHEALHARLSGRRGEEADRPAGAGGRRVLGLSAGALAGRDAARSGSVHARTPGTTCSASPSPARSSSPTAASTTISGSRRPGSATRRSSSATAAASCRPRRSRKSDWARHSYRVLNLVDNQVRSLRKRQVIDSFKAKPATRPPQGRLLGHPHRHRRLRAGRRAALPVRADDGAGRDADAAQAAGRRALQERLINWGYAVCDAALRKHVDPALAKPAAFPYPAAGVLSDGDRRFRAGSSSTSCSGRPTTAASSRTRRSSATSGSPSRSEPDKPLGPADHAPQGASRRHVAVRPRGYRNDSRSQRTQRTSGPNIAYLQGVVAARLYFDEVLRVVVPMTEWWQRQAQRTRRACEHSTTSREGRRTQDQHRLVAAATA